MKKKFADKNGFPIKKYISARLSENTDKNKHTCDKLAWNSINNLYRTNNDLEKVTTAYQKMSDVCSIANDSMCVGMNLDSLAEMYNREMIESIKKPKDRLRREISFLDEYFKRINDISIQTNVDNFISSCNDYMNSNWVIKDRLSENVMDVESQEEKVNFMMDNLNRVSRYLRETPNASESLKKYYEDLKNMVVPKELDVEELEEDGLKMSA